LAAARDVSDEGPIVAGGWPFLRMIKRQQQFNRTRVLLGLVVLAFIGLGFRLMDLQVWRHDELVKLAEQRSVRTTWHPAKRGDILDANGNQLATSVFVKMICADPSMIGGQQAVVARAIAPLLGMSEADLYQRLIPRVAKNSKGETVTNGLHYVRLQRNVTDETWQKIKTTMSQLTFGVDEKKLSKSNRQFLNGLRQSSVFTEPVDDQLRVYPNGMLAAHVLGFVGTQENTNHTADLFGYDGVEKFFDDKLRGASGWRVAGADSHGKELVSLRDEDVRAESGLNVVLTIDAAIQHIVESALAAAVDKHAPQSITGIVMRPRTGEILAMATLPSFDPNNLRTITTNTEPNRVITDVMEPGSTFKTLVISGALNEKVVKLSDQVFCENGVFNYAGIRLHDSEGHHFGNLTVQQVLQKSSNIGAAKIGMQLGADKLYTYMQEFGLGAFTGIPLPHEASASRFIHPLKGKYSIAQIPMGQGLAVTRLQMAMAFGAIASGGVLMHPMLVKRLEDPNGNVVQRYEPQSVRRVVTEATAKQMIEALKTVVSKDGTAPLAAITNYTVAGKTGTAQKVVDGRYSSEKFVISFIGFFPADNPEICISVVMDSAKEGGRAFGGALCGPVFSEIGRRCASYLNIPPDKTPPQSATAPTDVALAQTQHIPSP
jgi:cell division protein FtsI/penicillin-binding protein 2